MSSMTPEKLQHLLEAAMMAYGKIMSIDKMLQLFEEDKKPSTSEIREALAAIAESCEERGVELKEVASGFRFQAKQDYAEWIARLWEEKPPRYTRALLETLALIAYRQPITRSEIEDVRGVSVSSHIIKTLLEREWVRVVGHRDVPGRPALYATTKDFLDYFDLKSLQDLPSLSEIRDLDEINAELDLDGADIASEESGEQTELTTGSEALDGTEVSADEAEEESSTLEEEFQAAAAIAAKIEQATHALEDNLSDDEIAEEVDMASEEQQADEQVFNDAIEPDIYEEHEPQEGHAPGDESNDVVVEDAQNEYESSQESSVEALEEKSSEPDTHS